MSTCALGLVNMTLVTRIFQQRPYFFFLSLALTLAVLIDIINSCGYSESHPSQIQTTQCVFLQQLPAIREQELNRPPCQPAIETLNAAIHIQGVLSLVFQIILTLFSLEQEIEMRLNGTVQDTHKSSSVNLSDAGSSLYVCVQFLEQAVNDKRKFQNKPILVFFKECCQRK